MPPTTAELFVARGRDAGGLDVNAGIAAGQTVAHAHVQVIPRYAGDADYRRGGIRWIL
jgi:diadenosine tetraphosphate (Ap4A) HIT family hydrolase